MSPTEAQLLELLKIRSFKSGAADSYRLASGRTSNYYIDGKMSEVFSESAYLIGEVLYEHTRDLGVDAIGGLEVGAVPLTTAAVISYHRRGERMEGFWVRDKAKAHGTRKVIEGHLAADSRVVIVDDVVTSGSSAVKAIEEVQNIGCKVILVISLVDRLCGAEDLFRSKGIDRYHSIFTIRDFGVQADVRNPAHAIVG